MAQLDTYGNVVDARDPEVCRIFGWTEEQYVQAIGSGYGDLQDQTAELLRGVAKRIALHGNTAHSREMGSRLLRQLSGRGRIALISVLYNLSTGTI